LLWEIDRIIEGHRRYSGERISTRKAVHIYVKSELYRKTGDIGSFEEDWDEACETCYREVLRYKKYFAKKSK
jgi:hypothetical protein